MFAKIWTSTLQRTIETARQLNYTKLTWKSLDELDAGVCDGMTYEEIAVRPIRVIIYIGTLIPPQENYPEDFEARDEDKFNYRYRGGESYRDIVVRLEPVIMELERQENILIVCHQVSILAILDLVKFPGLQLRFTQAVLRCLYAYFHNLPQEDLPYIKIPLHTVIKLTPKAYGCDEERFKVPIEAVDTHRPKPKRIAQEGGRFDAASPEGVANLSKSPPTLVSV